MEVRRSLSLPLKDLSRYQHCYNSVNASGVCLQRAPYSDMLAVLLEYFIDMHQFSTNKAGNCGDRKGVFQMLQL